MMYVTQLPEASTHPKYMSQKDETRGTADSIRAANYLKRWAILYRCKKRIKLKEKVAACVRTKELWKIHHYRLDLVGDQRELSKGSKPKRPVFV